MRNILIAIALLVMLGSAPASTVQGTGSSLWFFGNGVNDIDRVKIKLDAPARPVDVRGSFTLEWWIKANPGENTGVATCGANDGWITGNIVFDRDVYGPGDFGDFGIALSDGRVAFGVSRGDEGQTVCGATDVADGNWHHLAVTRKKSGEMRLFVDGVSDGSGWGVAGNISYRDGRETQYPASDPFLVIGAEKHDAGQSYPSFSGWIDEIRISKGIRYKGSFVRPIAPFVSDAKTLGLYHMDEGTGNKVRDSSGAPGGPSQGKRRVGGTPTGPVWSEDTPF